MNSMLWLSLWLVIGLFVYLVYALFKAERF